MLLTSKKYQSVSEIISVLILHGCPDLSDLLDLSLCSPFPISGGGFGDVYRATLKDGSLVALKAIVVRRESTDQLKDDLKVR
jgi:hypothetical protein